MIIKSYECQRFAGLQDKKLEFGDNMNVILGPNEAGKSTLVEGIHSVLFKSSRLGYRSKEDKEFRDGSMPHLSGDTIDGKLILSDGAKEYDLSREWGDHAFSRLMTPDGQVIKDEEAIQRTLAQVLQFGEATYGSIFFSKQIHIKEAIEKIIQSRETTEEVGSVLRKAILELEGVSIDRLGQKIDDEINTLLKKWDVEKNYPENNKGVNNPYVKDVGQVLESYYKKETTRILMKEALKAEKDMEDIHQEMKSTEASLGEMRTKKEAMGQIENDVIKRVQLEPQIKELTSALTLLASINHDWPKHEMKATQLREDQEAADKKLEALEKEKLLAGKGAEKMALEKTIEKARQLSQQILDTEETLKNKNIITSEDITRLDQDHQKMITAEASMKAGKIFGKLNRLNTGTDLYVTRDLEEKARMEEGDQFTADGYLQIEAGELFQMELQSGELDFAQLRTQHQECKARIQETLERLGAETIEAVKLEKERQEELKRSLKAAQSQLAELLGEETLDSLQQKVKDIEALGKTRSLEELNHEIRELQGITGDKRLELRILEGSLKKWVEDYVSPDKLLDQMLDKKILLKGLEENLNKLAPMPEGYASADSFREELAQLRESYEKAQEKLLALKQQYVEIERNLPESTYEELVAMLELEEQAFEKKLEKGKKLLKIQEAFEETRRQIDETSFHPVTSAFSNYLALLTQGSYQVKEIDNGFNFHLDRPDDTTMPLNLLSTGTYDSVALALRLALLESIMGDTKGFLILDDCLVDLDPARKEMAVGIIKGFAEKHQVIFTTCSPETAEMLGGNVVRV